MECVRCAVAAAPEEEALAVVLMAVAKPMFFDELRIQQRLGYYVTSFARSCGGRLSLVFLVQTDRAPELARSRIAEFLDGLWRHVLEDLTEEAFSDYRSGVAGQLQESLIVIWGPGQGAPQGPAP